MNLLDENIRDDQRAVLSKWNIHFRQIGREISHAGIQDADLIPLLHKLGRLTFFTQDRDFYKKVLCHRAYCLVWLDVTNAEVGHYIRRFLRHPDFRAMERMGKVVRIRTNGLQFWQVARDNQISQAWPKLD